MKLRDYPGFLPGLLLTVVLAFVFGRRLARALRTSNSVGWGLIFGLGLVISATLTPGGDALRFGEAGNGSCDLGRLTLAPLVEVLRFGETGLNVVLFIPLGLALALLPRSRTKAILIVVALLVPLAIEVTQLLITPLGRECQSADVIDNMTGLIVGLLAGTLVGALIGRRRTM